MKFKFALQKVSGINPNIQILNTDLAISSLNLPYTDLSAISKSSIGVKRMKPLFSRPSDQNFIINGHFMYGMGASDFPTIGTV